MNVINGLNRKPGKYVSEEKYKSNVDSQMKMTPQTMSILQDYGVTEASSLKLEYFFYTNAEEKAKALADELESMGYSVEYEESAHDRNTQVITGWSVPLKMTTQVVLEWTEQMCNLGYAHDCEFDGWGTHPGQ